MEYKIIRMNERKLLFQSTTNEIQDHPGLMHQSGVMKDEV